jgi:hypothetical protein
MEYGRVLITHPPSSDDVTEIVELYIYWGPLWVFVAYSRMILTLYMIDISNIHCGNVSIVKPT